MFLDYIGPLLSHIHATPFNHNIKLAIIPIHLIIFFLQTERREQ